MRDKLGKGYSDSPGLRQLNPLDFYPSLKQREAFGHFQKPVNKVRTADTPCLLACSCEKGYHYTEREKIDCCNEQLRRNNARI